MYTLVEHAQQQVVGEIERVSGCRHGIHTTVEGEDCVLGSVFADRGHDDAVQEGDVLGARHVVVAVHVVEGEHVVTSRLEVADGK